MGEEHSDAQSPPASSPSWRHARELWAGLAIITMWLAVLFVGVFGGDFISSSSNGFTKIPVVVFLLPFVLPATIVVARRGLTGAETRPREDKTPAREDAATGPSAVRATHAG